MDLRTFSSSDVTPAVVGATGDFTVTDYLGSFKNAGDGDGQAFLVEQRAPQLQAHFHEVDQFQVFVSGSGAVGGDEVGPGSVHYADAYTAYGPIRTTDPAGVGYFTLRLAPTVGANFMPESRHKRAAAHGAGGHFTCEMPAAATASLSLLAESPRGARAYGARFDAGARIGPGLLPVGTARGYAVVLSGQVQVGGRVMPERSLIAFDRCSQLVGAVAEGDRTSLAVVVFAGAS